MEPCHSFTDESKKKNYRSTQIIASGAQINTAEHKSAAVVASSCTAQAPPASGGPGALSPLHPTPRGSGTPASISGAARPLRSPASTSGAYGPSAPAPMARDLRRLRLLLLRRAGLALPLLRLSYVGRPQHSAASASYAPGMQSREPERGVGMMWWLRVRRVDTRVSAREGGGGG